MKKGQKETSTGENEEYMANYKALVTKLCTLSRMNVRQFLGTRADGDPRVDYLAGVESFKNLANVQLQLLLGVVYALVGTKKPEVLKMMEDELGKQIEAMEESLAVTGWREDGTPILDLKAHLEKTQGWPS